MVNYISRLMMPVIYWRGLMMPDEGSDIEEVDISKSLKSEFTVHDIGVLQVYMYYTNSIKQFKYFRQPNSSC